MSTTPSPEQNAVTGLLSKLAGLLGPLSPFAKAVVPPGLAVAVAGVNSIFAGKIDPLSLTIAGSGLVLGVVTYLVPNKAKPAAAPAKTAAAKH